MEVFSTAGRVATVDSVLESAGRSMPNPSALLRFVGNVLQLTGHEADARRQYVRAAALGRIAARRGDSLTVAAFDRDLAERASPPCRAMACREGYSIF